VFGLRSSGALLVVGVTAITVTKAGKTVKASRLMILMNLGIKKGDEITVTAEGAAEEEAVAAPQKFFEENL